MLRVLRFFYLPMPFITSVRFLEPEGELDNTWKVKQDDIKQAVDLTSANKVSVSLQRPANRPLSFAMRGFLFCFPTADFRLEARQIWTLRR
jgi:hypothetical protein